MYTSVKLNKTLKRRQRCSINLINSKLQLRRSVPTLKSRSNPPITCSLPLPATAAGQVPTVGAPPPALGEATTPLPVPPPPQPAAR